MPAWNKINVPERKLRDLYINKKLSIFQISERFGCTTGLIHRNLKEYKIPRRSLSEACTKIPISRKELQEWYWKDKMSMFEIADKLKCTHSAIVQKFKKLGIKSRGHLGITKPIRLDKEKFEYLYQERRLSLDKIAKIIHCSEGGIERRFKKYNLISRGNKNRACKYKKTDFSGNLVEKAYLIGFRLGDLNVMNGVSIIQVRCSSTIPAQIKLIKNLFIKYSTPRISRYIDRKFDLPKIDIVFLVNRSFDFLLPKEDKIPKWVLKNNITFWSFFAGYTDAEGCFYIHKAPHGKTTAFAGYEIQTQQKGIINKLWKEIEKFGIRATIPKISVRAGHINKHGTINNKDMWRFSINRKDSLLKFLEYISPYIKHPNKIRKIKEVRENIVLRNALH